SGGWDAAPARGALDLTGVQAPRAHFDLRDHAIVHHADDLKVRLPHATGLVVRMRDVVAERDATAAAVADVARDLRHDDTSLKPISSIRAISAPSPLRNPVLRIRVYPPWRVANFGATSWNSMSAAARLWMCRAARRRACSVPVLPFVIRRSTNGRSSLALASVVSIAPFSIKEIARFLSNASLCSLVRRNWRPALRCRTVLTPRRHRARSRPHGSVAFPNR